MKKSMRILSIAACTITLTVSLMMTASATSFVRKFNGAQGVKNSVAAAGNSTYSNGIVTMSLPASGSLCWSYIPDVKNLTFQFRIDTDTDPEFDWFGMNITTGSSDPYDMLLGHGNGLSTLFWRTSNDVTSRFVEENCKWDNATKKEISSKPLYDGVANIAPYEGFCWGGGDWATFSMVRAADGRWNITVNGIDMVQNRYSGFDADMDRLFLNASETVISFFLSNPSGTLQLRGVDSTVTTTANTTATNTTAATSSSQTTTTGNNTVGNTTTAPNTDSSNESGVTVTAATDENGSTVTTTTNAGGTITGTTKATDADSNAEVIGDGDTDTASSFPWAVLIAVVVLVLAGTGAALYFFVIKKKHIN